MLHRSSLFALFMLGGVSAVTADDAVAIGSVYGTTTGCDAVAAGQYPASDDWVVVTRKYMRQHESICEFVQTVPDKYGSLFVNAICSGEGDTWPATFVIAVGEDEGTVRVSDTNNNPWDVHACEGVTDAAADKLFGE